MKRILSSKQTIMGGYPCSIDIVIPVKRLFRPRRVITNAFIEGVWSIRAVLFGAHAVVTAPVDGYFMSQRRFMKAEEDAKVTRWDEAGGIELDAVGLEAGETIQILGTYAGLSFPPMSAGNEFDFSVMVEGFEP